MMQVHALGAISSTLKYESGVARSGDSRRKLAVDSLPIFPDCLRNGSGKGALVGQICDELGLVGIIHETSFEENGGVAHASEDAEAGPADTAVGSAGLEEARAVDRRCKSDVGRILAVALQQLEIVLADSAPVVGDPGRG